MYYTSVIIIFGFSILALSKFYAEHLLWPAHRCGNAGRRLMGSMLLLPRLIIFFKPLGKESDG